MKKPVKPKNPKKRFDTSVSSWSVQELLDFCRNTNIPLDEAKLDYEEDDYMGTDVLLYWYGNKYPKETFDKMLKNYENKKRQYDEWFKENEEFIVKSIEDDKKKKKEKEIAQLLAEKEKIEKQLSKLK